MAAVDSFRFLEQEIVENLNCVRDALAIYGVYHLARNLVKLPTLLKPIYSLSKNKNNLKTKFGTYAVITSIRQELGREIAINLASKGINLIVFTTLESEEHDLEFIRSLQTDFHIEILNVNLKNLKIFNRCSDGFLDRCTDKNDSRNVDAANNDASNEDDALRSILRKDIGILINCLDYRPMQMNKFLSYSDQEIDKLIYYNLVTPLKLQKLFFRKLVERERGLVLNIANSIATHSITPYQSVYAASKQFFSQLNNSIEYEYGKHNTIQFKTLMFTYFTSYLFKNEISETDKTIEKQTDNESDGLLSRFIIRLLPSKQQFITNLLESNSSTKTGGHWLLNLEFYLTDHLPDLAFNLISELIFCKND